MSFNGFRPLTFNEQRGQQADKKPCRKVIEKAEPAFDHSVSRCIECRHLLSDEDHFFVYVLLISGTCTAGNFSHYNKAGLFLYPVPFFKSLGYL